MKEFNVKQAVREYRAELKKQDAIIGKAEDSKLSALCALSSTYMLYDKTMAKARTAFLVELFGEGKQAASRRSEGLKMIMVAPFYGEMKKAFKLHSGADSNLTKPRQKDFILKLATKLRKVEEFDSKDKVAKDIYKSLTVKTSAGKPKPPSVERVIKTIQSLTPAKRRQVLAAFAEA